MVLSRIEFSVGDAELLILAEFAVQNETALTRPENWASCRRELMEAGWSREHADELLHSFAKQLDNLHAAEHRRKHERVG